MQIENPEALRTWLTAFLEPLCDADPVALSKYVLALVKKDKSEMDLRASMTEQMNVFLQKATRPFIDHLFKALESKEYLEGPPTHPMVPDLTGGEEVAKVKEEPGDGGDAGGEKHPADSTTPVRDDSAASAATAAHHHPGGDDAAAERHSGGSRRDGGDRYRRGEGYERSRRRSSRSPQRRSAYSRRSPPPGGRSRFGRGGSPPRGRSRSRSPVYRRSSRRSPPYRLRSRSRSFSPSYKRRPAADSRGSTPIRDEEGANPYLAASGNAAAAPPGVPPPNKRARCRDYDEKGFCMRGDQCKFDHGTDAVVLEDAGAAAAGVQPYQPAGATAYAEPYVPASASLPLPPLNVPPPGYQPSASAVPSTAYPIPPAIPRKRTYDPTLDDSSYPPHKLSAFSRLGPAGAPPRGGFRGGFRGGRGGRGAKQIAVRNIPPPVNNIAHLNNHFAKFGNLVNVQVQFEGDPASALVTFAAPGEAEAAFNSAEAVLGNRFIKMFYHYERPSAPPSHRGAFHTGAPKPLRDRLGPVNPAAPATGGEAGEKVKYEGDILTKTIPNTPEKTPEEEAKQKSEEKAAAIAAIKKNQDMLEAKAQLKKEAEEKRAEQLKKVTELQKNKQELLEKLIDQQKKLILKVEEAKKPEEKTALMKLVKSVSASIEKAKEEVKKAVAAQQQQQQQPRKSPVELQKELLDAELELHQAEQDGSEATAEIQKKVNRLRLEAAKGGLLPTSRPPRGGGGMGRGFSPMGRGGYPVRGRGGGYYSPRGLRGGRMVRRGGRFVYQGATIDRRPTKILVSGFDAEEKEELVAHFQKFGEMLEPLDQDEGGIVVQFHTRREAEMAMNGGKAFGEKMLNLSWFVPPPGSTDFDNSAAAGGATAGDGSPGGSLLLSPTSGAGGGEGGAGSVAGGEEDDDDYTPLDPAYLPDGLDQDEADKENLETTNEDVNNLLYDGEDEPAEEGGAAEEGDKAATATAEEKAAPEEEEEEEEEDGERSWKR